MIDLHTHSTASDGSLGPAELIDRAEREGLAAVALTDHDTVDGIEEAINAAEGRSLSFVPGLEISAELERGTLHLVGLFVDHRNAELRSTLDWLVEVRDERNTRIIDRLNQIGLEVELEEVRTLAGGPVVGRPHFARALVARGHVRDARVAFDRYLGKGGSAYVSKQRLDARRAITLIRNAGGVPILAHPDQTKRRGTELSRLVRSLTTIGLCGIEVHCSGYNAKLRRSLASIAQEHGLLISGGTDYHGPIKPGIRLGVGPGNLRVPDELLGLIEEKAAEIHAERQTAAE